MYAYPQVLEEMMDPLKEFLSISTTLDVDARLTTYLTTKPMCYKLIPVEGEGVVTESYIVPEDLIDSYPTEGLLEYKACAMGIKLGPTEDAEFLNHVLAKTREVHGLGIRHLR